jgi:hypothetical protein
MKINGNEIVFTDEHPKKQGTYLWKHKCAVETILVVSYPAKNEYGTDWPAYLGIPDFGGRDVHKLSGTFCEIVIDDDDFS